MLILALDTSSPAVTTGLVELNGPVLASAVTHDARAHVEALTPQVSRCLAEAGVSVRELAAIVVGVGPGPFTGLRVGLMTAASLADALAIPAYPVCSLDALALAAVAALGEREPGELLIAGDARRRELYWGRYAPDATRLEGPHVERPALVAERAGGARWAAGGGAELYSEALGLPLLAGVTPTPAALVEAARAQLEEGAAPAPLTPLYLRRPDAVPSAGVKTVVA